jgi:hypothetical protein
VVGIFRRRDVIIRLKLFWPSTTTNGPNHAGTWAGNPRRMPQRLKKKLNK